MVQQYNSKFALEIPLDKDEFEKYITGEMRTKDAKNYEKDQLVKRFYYIVHKIGQITGFKVDWFDYDNEGGEDYPGSFDIDSYQENIGFTGHFIHDKNLKERFEDYDTEFPTKWMTEDFEAQLKKEVKDFEKDLNQANATAHSQKLAKKAEADKFQASIRSKLTEEEMAYITFATLEQIEKNKQAQKNNKNKEVAKQVKSLQGKGIDITAEYESYRSATKNPKKFDLWIVEYVTQSSKPVKKLK